MLEQSELKKLKNLAMINRKKIIDMIYHANNGHPGGSLSIIDILTYIYEKEVDLNSRDKDRVILSKGHATPAIYAVFNHLGYISDDELCTFRKINSRLQGHPVTTTITELDATTGLLGQGLSLGVGMALGKKLKNDIHRVFVILGDGEMHEGQVWEALMEGSHYKLDNLIAIIDYNKLSSLGNVNDVMNIRSLDKKMESFGWNVIEIDGHSFEQIAEALNKAKQVINKPVAIVAHTIKGKGISFMENNPIWHSRALSNEEYKAAIAELGF
jgi:transketolase